MAFSIRFTDDPDEYIDEDSEIPSAIGLIRGGELEENFVSSLYEWDKEAYQSQWIDSLQHFVDGADRAVLITWYVNSKESSNLQWWALYRGEGGVAHVQNHLPRYDMFGREFSVAKADSFLHDRTTVSESGDAISEWNVPISDIQSFLDRLKQHVA